MIELLKDGTYLRYWLAVVVSFLGDAMTRVTLVYVAARLTDSPVVISLVVLSQLLPSGLLGAFVGPLADRLPARLLLIGSDLVRVPVVLAMIPALDSIGWLLALILLEGAGKAVFETARVTAIPKIVGSHHIPSAVALFQTTNQTVNLLGPALGGVLVALGSTPVVLTLNAATFVVSALLLGSLGVLRDGPAQAGRAAEPYWTALRTGVRGVLAVPTLRFLFAFLVPVMLVSGVFTTNVNAQLLTVFDLQALEYGTAQGLLAGGAILGALLGPALIRRFGAAPGLLLTCGGLFGAALLTPAWLGDRPALGVIAGWCLLMGAFASLFQVPVANMVLRDLPEETRGRGVGLLNAVMVNVTIVGVAAGGPAAGGLGVAGSLVASGAVLLVAAVAFVPAARRLSSRPLSASQRPDAPAVPDVPDVPGPSGSPAQEPGGRGDGDVPSPAAGEVR
ncbi:MFS transporter [Nonomuraea sp. NN258]|uniref:MFS transporter n=1 Tax=Nonomuraea antri TaxID=2730852 RepID=UPI001569925A|nr:MFS transporter [Nonomuraea antri]NRQ31778.1 MFS transporter [Nonomuraea antri]